MKKKSVVRLKEKIEIFIGPKWLFSKGVKMKNKLEFTRKRDLIMDGKFFFHYNYKKGEYIFSQALLREYIEDQRGEMVESEMVSHLIRGIYPLVNPYLMGDIGRAIEANILDHIKRGKKIKKRKKGNKKKRRGLNVGSPKKTFIEILNEHTVTYRVYGNRVSIQESWSGFSMGVNTGGGAWKGEVLLNGEKKHSRKKYITSASDGRDVKEAILYVQEGDIIEERLTDGRTRVSEVKIINPVDDFQQYILVEVT